MKFPRPPKTLNYVKVFMVAAVVLLAIYGIATTVHDAFTNDHKVSATAARSTYKAQVDNDDGSPVSGRNPAAQAQSSLAAAASTPTGTGTHTDQPAASVQGSTNTKVKASQVYTDKQKKTGVSDAGCFYDYGIPGQQCMPAGMAKADGTLDCNAVRMHFPKGLKVSGTDRFHLDRNHDGVACGKND